MTGQWHNDLWFLKIVCSTAADLTSPLFVVAALPPTNQPYSACCWLIRLQQPTQRSLTRHHLSRSTTLVGGVLGPLPFLIYTGIVTTVIRNSTCHLYAVDKQIHIHFYFTGMPDTVNKMNTRAEWKPIMKFVWKDTQTSEKYWLYKQPLLYGPLLHLQW